MKPTVVSLRGRAIWAWICVIAAMLVGAAWAGGLPGLRGGASILVSNEYMSPSGSRYVPIGEQLTYSVRLINNGGAAPIGSTVQFSAMAGLTALQWSCAAIAPATCNLSNGNGLLDEPIDSLAAGGELIYTITAQQQIETPPFIETIATVNLDAASVCADMQTPPCRATSRVPAGANITTSLVGSRTGYNQAQFTFTASHSSNSRAAEDAQIFMQASEGLLGFTWTCVTLTAGAACPNASGVDPINETVTGWPVGDGYVYTINATIVPVPDAGLYATAQVNLPKGGSCGADADAPPCVAMEALPSAPHVYLTKTATLLAGGDIGYSVTVNNAGPGSAALEINDEVPDGLSEFTDFTCTANGAVTCPSVPDLTNLNVTLPANSGMTFEFTGVIDPSNPRSEITNTVTADMALGVCNDTADPPPCEAWVTTGMAGALRVEKTANVTSARAGDTIGYEIRVTNESTTSSASIVYIGDELPAGIESFSWTCSSVPAALCPNDSGIDSIFEVIYDLPPGATITYNVNALVSDSPPPVITNEAFVNPEVPGFNCAPSGNATPCFAQVDVTSMATFEVSKTLTSTGPRNAPLGGGLSYQLLIEKKGPTLQSVRITDDLPVGIDDFSWTCVADVTNCPQASGTGAIDVFIPEMPAGDVTFVFEVDATPSASPPSQIINTLSVDAPAMSATCLSGGATSAPPCLSTVTVATMPALSISKTATQTQVLRGGTIDYLITLSNDGTTTTGVGLEDALPTGLESMDWSCTGYLGVACPSFSGTGPISVTTGNFPAGARLEFNVSGIVAQSALSTITNTATVVPPAGGNAICVGGDCSASVSVPVVSTPAANLQVMVTSSSSAVQPGGTFNYVVDLRNIGSVPANNLQLSVPLPSGVTDISWTCEGSACPQASGSGAIAATIPSLGVYDAGLGESPVTNGRVVYTLTGTVATAAPTSINLSATVTPAGTATCAGGVCSSNLTLPVSQITPVLNISMTADRSQLDLNGAVNYEIRLTNNSASVISAINVANAVPAGLTAYSWQCAVVNSAVCPQTSGNGAINQLIEDIGTGSAVVYTISANVAATASSPILNNVTATPTSPATCSPASCAASVSLPLAPPGVPNVVVSKSINVGAGSTVTAGQAIVWTLRASNSSVPTTGALTLSDALPTNIRAITVSAPTGVNCSSAAPAAGSTLTCTIAAGFTGTREVSINATVVEADGLGGLRNSVTASGIDSPSCASCTVVNPMPGVAGIDIELRNPRPYSAAGIAGTLVDVVNLSATEATQVPVRLTPASTQRLLATYASGCTASAGTGGNVSVSCPNPATTQGVSCSGSVCTIGRLSQGAAVTLFVALNAGASATLRAEAAGDTNSANDAINLSSGVTP